MGKRVSVTRESDSGRNERFRDNSTGREMSRSEFVREIQREITGIITCATLTGCPLLFRILTDPSATTLVKGDVPCLEQGESYEARVHPVPGLAAFVTGAQKSLLGKKTVM
jgi:hypothetical protein